MDRESIKRHLESKNHVSIKDKSYPVQLGTGENLGNVGYSTMLQLRKGRNVSNITPKNDEEKSVLEKYQKYIAQKEQKVDTSSSKQREPSSSKKDSFGSWMLKNINAGAAQFNKGIAATLDFILPTEFLGRYDFISKFNDYTTKEAKKRSQAAVESSQSRGKGWKTTGDVVASSVAALPNAILAIISGGSSLAANGTAALGSATSASSATAMLGQSVKKMVENPMFWTSALHTLGADYESAKERGANDLVASATAILTTAINAGIEIGGGIEELPKKLKSGGKNAIFNWAKSTFEEGGEEVLQGITTNAMAKLMYDYDAPLFSNSDETALVNPTKMAKEFGMGATVGGLLGGVQTGAASAVNTADIIRTGKYFNKPDLAQTVIQTGLESPADSEAYKNAVKLNEQKKISNYDLGKQYQLNVEQIKAEEDAQANAPSVAYGEGDGSISREQNALAKNLSGTRGRGVTTQQAEADIAAINNKAVSSIAETVQTDAEAVDGGAVSRANTAFLSRADALVDADFVRAYADSFVAGLAAKNSSGYRHLSSVSEDVAGDLVNYAVNGTIPTGYDKQAAYAIETFAGDFSRVVQDMASSAYAAKTKFYTEVPYMSRQISALREGNLKEAMRLADYQKISNAAYERFKAGNTVTLGEDIIAVADTGGNGYFVFGEHTAKLAELTGMEATTMLFGEDAIPMLVLSSRDTAKLFGVSGHVKETAAGYALTGMPSEAELEMVAKDVVEKKSIVEMSDENMESVVLMYDEDNVNEEQVKKDIAGYYQEGIIPESADVGSMPWDEMQLSVSDENEAKITIDDVNAIRSIGRKSVNDFTAEDIKKSESWARKFLSELGTKSPFFRLWFGDWRTNDTAKVEVAVAVNREGKNPRGAFVNNDTGWSINSSSIGYDETVSHSGKDKMSLIAMRNIDKIIQNAVLLDSEVSEYGRGKKSVYTAFMHKFYALVNIDGNPYIAKMSVDESYNPGQIDTNKKFYHVRAIKIEPLPSVGIGFNHTPIMDGKDSIISISDLFAIVKNLDQNFKPKPVSKVVNENGTPKVVYHGTADEFYIFDKQMFGKNTGAPSARNAIFFTDSKNVATGYAEDARPDEINALYKNAERLENQSFYNGKYAEAEEAWRKYEEAELDYNGKGNVMAAYLDIKNPLIYDFQGNEYREKTYNDLIKQAKTNGNDGVIFLNTYDGSNKNRDDLCTVYAIFDSTQIKSATDNIGTFNGSNPDIRYSNNNGGIRNERNDILSGNLGRKTGESAGEQGGSLQKVTGRSQTESGSGESDSRSRRVYAETVRASGQTQERRVRQVRAEFVNEEGYTPEMQRIAEENAARGIKATYFFLGRAGAIVRGADGHLIVDRSVDFRGAYADGIVYLRCDDANFSASQINRHELVHDAWNTPEMKVIEKQIAKSLTDEDMNYIKNVLYSHCADIVNGDETAIFQEFVADTLAGMNEYSAQFANIADTYWNQTKSDIDIYSPATYTESIDAGGVNGNDRSDFRQGVSRISENFGNPEGRDSSNQPDVSLRLSETQAETTGSVSNSRREESQNGSHRGVEGILGSAEEAEIQPGPKTDGERYIQAIRNGGERQARELLDKQALANGFVPAEVYHATDSEKVFTEFESEGANWVSTDLEYAMRYSDEYAGDDAERSAQLHTYPNSAIYSLYVKPGNVLDAGDINQEVKSHDDLFAFADSIGFSHDEILRCWNSGRVYESNALWTATITPEFAAIAKEHGYDSIKALENDGKVVTYGILYPENIKSAKTVAYDDSNRIIPLEERFNTEKKDIRFSASDDTDTESLDSLADTTYDYLSDPISSIQDDMKDVQMRAELREGKVYEPQDARQICASILDNLDVGTGRGISMTRQNKYRAQILIYRALNTKETQAQAEGWRKVAAFVAQNAVVQDTQEYFDYTGTLQQVRDITKHSFNLKDADKQILDAALGESAKGYKALFGGGTRGADEVYAELSDVRPDLFPSNVTTDGDQLMKIVEVYQWLKEGGEQKSVRLLSVLDTFEDRQAFERLIQTQIQEAVETQGRPSRVSAERAKYEQRYQAEMERVKSRYEKQIAKLKEETQSKAKERLAEKNIKPQPYVRPEGLTVASRKYGRIAPGESPVRDVEMPRKVSDDRYVSRFARTMMEAGATPDAAISEFEERILDGTMTYERITDKQAKAEAEKNLKNMGFAEALKHWNNLIDTNVRMSKEQMTLGMMLYNQCVNAKDVKNAMKIAADLARIGTYSGQVTQSLRILKQLSPDAQLYNLEKCVDRINSDLEKHLKKKYKEIKIDEKLAEEYLTAETKDAREAALEQMEWQVAEQIPSTTRDKLASWRYFAMLANPRTHVRNLAGNAIFVPAVEIKNFIGTALEKTLSKEQRTKAIARAKGTVEYAKEDFKKILPALSQNSGGKYSEVMAGIEGKRTIFQSKVMKPLEKARRGNFKLLELEDDLFKQRAYVSSFSGMMTARGYTEEFLNSGTLESNQALDDLRAYAWDEALKATYQDVNALANWISKAQNELKKGESWGKRAGGLLLEGVLPFKRTPLNIVKRAMEYSPYGLVKGGTEIFNGIRTGEWTPAQALDDLAKGLSGTMIMSLGALLAYLGIIDGVGDEDDKVQSWEEAQGYQEYALRIGDYTYTIDWAAPASLPLFIGVEIMNMLDSEGLKIADVLNVMSRITEPMMELSVLQGLSSAITTAGYSKQDPISAIATDVMLSYFGQYIPTLLGQFARTIDPTRRTTYNDKNSNLPKVLDSFIQRMEAKIPFASYALQPRLDVWGREENYGDTVAERIFGNFISPGYLKDIDSTAADKELERLYGQTGDNSILPAKPSKYFSEDGTRYDLTGSQYTKYSKIVGQEALKKIDSLIKTSAYKNATDAEKATAIAEILTNAKDKGKDAILRDMEVTKWYSGASLSASETLEAVQDDKAYYKVVANLSPTGKTSLEYEKSAMIASYVDSAREIINTLPKEEQKAAGAELVATVKKLRSSFTVDNDLAAELGTKELESVFGQSKMPEADISYTKNKVKHEYTLTASQYNDYVVAVMGAIQKERAKVRSSYAYRNASTAQKIELLKESDSSAKSEVKQLFQKKYAGKK